MAVDTLADRLEQRCEGLRPGATVRLSLPLMAEILAALRRVAEPVGEDAPSDGEIYSLTSFGGDRAAKDSFMQELKDGHPDWLAGDVDCEGNELVTIRADELRKLRDEREKFMWQVRDTCARAEKAEAAIAGDDRVARLTEALGRIFDTLKYSPNPYAMDAVRIARAALEDTRDGN